MKPMKNILGGRIVERTDHLPIISHTDITSRPQEDKPMRHYGRNGGIRLRRKDNRIPRRLVAIRDRLSRNDTSLH